MARARRRLATAALLPFAACQPQPVDISVWPPRDFAIDVRELRMDESGIPRIAQRFQVWSDGLAAYREADRETRIGGVDVPVFESVCVYELHPNSLRMLGRLLQRAGLFEPRVAAPDGRAPRDGDVSLRFVARDEEGVVGSWSEDPVVFDRLLHVVNAFVPQGHELGAPQGEAEPRHVSEAPKPVDGIDAAIEAHRLLVDMRPDDAELQRELDALESLR